MSRTRSPRAPRPATRDPTVMSFAPPPPSRPPPHDHPIDPEFATRYIPPDECEFHPPTTCNGLSVTREDIEAVLGMRVMSFELYETACTHKTAATAMSVPSYERLEFIGDSVLNFVVAKYLFDTYPTKDEGFLTRVRTKLVSGKFLSVVAWRMGMHRVVVMDQKGLMRGWNASAGVLEDVFEALVGAMYLDLGLVEAREFIRGRHDPDRRESQGPIDETSASAGFGRPRRDVPRDPRRNDPGVHVRSAPERSRARPRNGRLETRSADGRVLERPSSDGRGRRTDFVTIYTESAR